MGGMAGRKEIAMNDYEKIFVSSVGSPWAGMCGLTISEGKVRLFPAVLRKIGSPERIMIHLGVRSNEGKIIVEAAENVPGSILVDYDRKKYCFYSSELVEPLKNLIRKYAHGEFMPGIYYTVKGTAIGENVVEFDFRDAVHRVVNVDQELVQKMRDEKKKSSGRKENQKTSGHTKVSAFSASSGFNMPNMAGRMT